MCILTLIRILIEVKKINTEYKTYSFLKSYSYSPFIGSSMWLLFALSFSSPEDWVFVLSYIFIVVAFIAQSGRLGYSYFDTDKSKSK